MRRGWAVAIVVAMVMVGAVSLVRCRSSRTTDQIKADHPGGDVDVRSQRSGGWRYQPRASITGTITDDRGPLSRARVCALALSIALPRSITRWPRCTTADADGRYSLVDLYAAEYAISAVAERHLPGWLETFELHAGEQRAGVDLELVSGGVEITGTVSDLGGGPIARASVAAISPKTYESSATVETDDAGAFRMWVSPGRIEVEANADGYTKDTRLAVAPGAFELVLTPESSLAGIVLDARTRAPQVGAVVTLARDDGLPGDREDELDRDTTDESGRFHFEGLVPGRYAASAVAEAGYGRTGGSVAVGLGQRVDGAVIEVQPAARVEGRVMIAGTPDRPCPKASLQLLDWHDEQWRLSPESDDGVVRVTGVLPGSYSVSVRCEGYDMAVEPAKLDVADRDLTGLSWRMVPEPARGTVRGHVRMRSGQPVANAVVASNSVHTSSKSDGSYELANLDPGGRPLEVTSELGNLPGDPSTVVVAAGAVVVKDLVLEPGGAIAGTVVDGDGHPVARVSVVTEASDYITVYSAADGSFRFPGLPPGEYTLSLSAVGPDREYHHERVTVRANETARVKLVVAAAPESISGIVVDADGKPLGDAFVVAAREGGYVNTRPWDSHDGSQVLTEVDGTFTIAHLVAGSYTLRAFRTGGGEVTTEHVATGSRARLQIKPTGSIAGTIHTPAGEPMALTIRIANTTTGFTQVERCYRTGGRYHVDDLPAGELRITASADELDGQTTVTLADGAQLTGVDLTIDAPVTLVGRVIDLESRQPVAGADVTASLRGTGRMYATHHGPSDAAGRFTLTDVPRGPVDVEVQTDTRYFNRYLQRVVATAGTIDVGDLTVVRSRLRPDERAGYLGIELAEDSLRVIGIDRGSPAASSALAVGDVVTAINEVTELDAGTAYSLLHAPAGTTFHLAVARGVTIAIVSTAAAPP